MSSSTQNPLCIVASDDVFQYDVSSPGVKDAPDTCTTCENITVEFRLVSPSFTLFDRYDTAFASYLSAGLNMTQRQVVLVDYRWQKGPRLDLDVLLFPQAGLTMFNQTELDRLYASFSTWKIPDSEVFGPYELISFEPRSLKIGRYSTQR